MEREPAERTWHRLRPLEHADVPEVASWFWSVEDLGMFAAGIALPLSAAALERRWASIIDGDEPRTSWLFVVEDPRGALVGLSGIEDVNLVHGTGVAPLWVADRARHHGVGLIMRALVLDLAFNQLGLHRILSMHRADNEASRRVNEACGLKPEGTLREAWRDSGRRVDVSVYGILAAEWRSCRYSLAQSMKTTLTLRCGDDPRSEWPSAVLAWEPDAPVHATDPLFDAG